MPYQSLAEAGAAVGRNRTTILKAIRRGAISATRDEVTGNWSIEAAELHRVFPPVDETTSRNGPATADNGELREVRARLSDALSQVDDLRRRLDVTTGQLGEALQQVRVLTDQRAAPAPIRRWWRFGR